jgi:hypothetical protein
MLRPALSISPKKPGMLLLDGKYAKKIEFIALLLCIKA